MDNFFDIEPKDDSMDKKVEAIINEPSIEEEVTSSSSSKKEPNYGASVTVHPDKDEIDKRLLRGESPRSIERWLKRKYKTKDGRISWLTIERYRSSYLNLSGEALKRVKLEQKQKNIETSAECKNMSIEAVEKRKTAINKALDIAESIDYTRRLIESRISLLTSRDDDKSEKNLVSYVGQLRQLTQLYFDIMQKISDEEEKKGFNIEKVQRQISEIVKVIKDVLMEFAPQLLPIFIERFAEKMKELDSEKTPTVETNYEVQP